MTPVQLSVRDAIRNEIASIIPLDDLETTHQNDALSWIDSGVPIFRTAKPATPPKHLVSYFVVMDKDHVLLVEHRNAGLWLPTGGHVEPLEHPRSTVARELQEEVGLTLAAPLEAPLMISCTTTVGATAGHTDVSLWYLVEASRETPLTVDFNEFHCVRWFAPGNIPLSESDPHLGRFMKKLEAYRLRQTSRQTPQCAAH